MGSESLALRVVELAFLETFFPYSFHAIFLRFRLSYRAWEVGRIGESMAFSEMGFKAILPDCWTARSTKRTYSRHIGSVLVVEADQIWAI
jgi:hypothetical protein